MAIRNYYNTLLILHFLLSSFRVVLAFVHVRERKCLLTLPRHDSLRHETTLLYETEN